MFVQWWLDWQAIIANLKRCKIYFGPKWTTSDPNGPQLYWCKFIEQLTMTTYHLTQQQTFLLGFGLTTAHGLSFIRCTKSEIVKLPIM